MKKMILIGLLFLVGAYYAYNYTTDHMRHEKVNTNEELHKYLRNKFPAFGQNILLNKDQKGSYYIQFIYLSKDPNINPINLFKEFTTNATLVINDNKSKLSDLRGFSVVIIDDKFQQKASAIFGFKFLESLNYTSIEKDGFKYIETQAKEFCPRSDPSNLINFCTLRL